MTCSSLTYGAVDNSTGLNTILTRFNKIPIQATAQMAEDKEAVGFKSRVHIYICMNLSVSCSYEMIVYTVLKHINTIRMHTINGQFIPSPMVR